jgi:biopolymer transport protein ExbB
MKLMILILLSIAILISPLAMAQTDADEDPALNTAGTAENSAASDTLRSDGAASAVAETNGPEDEAVDANDVDEDLATPADTGWLVDVALFLDSGGPVVMLLLAMSVIALSLVLLKLYQFRRARLWQHQAAQQALDLWQQGNTDAALEVADASANPAAQALARAIRGIRRQLPESAVREELLRYGSDALFQLRRGFRPLEVIGSLAPLLGLLGTVLGMIEAFRQLEAAGNQVNPAILSGGIWEALLTTAVGLCVAIPVVAVLNWLERCVDHLAHAMDNLVTQMFTEDLSADAERSQDSPVAKLKPASSVPASVKE